ncbi:MAG: efflux RND transporter periplasmic adaptor subunit [Gammaproteobacteria bacterium]|nr:efflux RND transporter periplasmic adaptor subunit [Gammaproteobacteria bacterium]
MTAIKRTFTCGLFCVWGFTATFAPASELETVTVNRVDLPQLYRFDGVVEAVNRGTVSAQTAGRILAVNFDVDDRVRQGEIILVIEDREQQAEVDRARANLDTASAKRQESEQEFRRVEGVYARQAASKAEMERATAARNQARAAEQAAAAALQQALQQLGYTRVAAPYNGIVTERHIEVGETAQPGQPMMSGMSLDDLRISVDLPQNLVELVRVEHKAQAMIGGKWIDISDVTLFPVADPRSDTIEVRLQLPQGIDHLFPGMYVPVGFVAGSRQALIVPLAAVVFRSEVVGVYVVNGAGQVHLRQIRLGSQAGEHTMVLSGLDAGERVALDPVAAGILLKSQRTLQVNHE